jgi:uncharacterized membrane protein YoaK (UPF0700 family)
MEDGHERIGESSRNEDENEVDISPILAQVDSVNIAPSIRSVSERLIRGVSNIDVNPWLDGGASLRRQPRSHSGDVSARLDDEFQHVYEESPEDLNDHTPAVRVSPMNAKYSYREHLFIVFLGTVLSFSSGFSNGVSLSGLLLTEYTDIIDRQSTSGMTGVYTRSALVLANTNYEDTGNLGRFRFMGFQLSIILSYIFGSLISAVLNPRPAPWRLAPMYVPTFFLGALLMCIAAGLAAAERYIQFQVPYFFHLVAMANGVQNGVSSMYSANLIRTTHLTGTTTDIGLLLGQYFRGNT